MAPTIRIDEEVWQWLKSHAAPLEDTPNSVLRRLAGLDAPSSTSPVVRQAAVADNTPPVRSAAAILTLSAPLPRRRRKHADYAFTNGGGDIGVVAV